MNNLNVLVLMSDEHNPMVAGYAGDSVVSTPNLNALASVGTEFMSAYTTDPICVAARRAFHSGRTGSNIEAGNYEAMGTYFGRQGFRTAWFGKQHWDGLVNNWQEVGVDVGRESKRRHKQAGVPFMDGSRRIEDAGVYTTPMSFHQDSICVEQAVNFLDSLNGERFFMGVSLVNPHFPFLAYQQFLDLYVDSSIERPTVTPAMLANLSTAMQLDRQKFGFANLTDEQCDFARKVYYAMVSFMDHQMGIVLARLEALGLRENTVVVYLSDHGEMLGSHGVWYKNCFYEGSARVPLIVSTPDQQFGGLETAPVSLLDVYPTLCRLCDLEPPTHLEGQDLFQPSGRTAFSENKRQGIAARMIRTNDYKYSWYADGKSELYDMVFDSQETSNLTDDPAHASVKSDLHARAMEGWNPAGLFDGGD